MVAGATPLQEFSHQSERNLAVSPRLNQDVQDLAFAVQGTPDVQLPAVDGDKRFVEMPPHVSRPSRLSLRAMMALNFKAQRRVGDSIRPRLNTGSSDD